MNACKVFVTALLCGLLLNSVKAGTPKEEPVKPENSTATEAPMSAKMKPLTDDEKRVIINKGTERAFTGKFHNHKDAGLYVCRQCGAGLYRSTDKFDSGCGWPSFDDEIKGTVTRTADADGRRTEITCTQCGGHLGHVFLGEGFTKKDTRHCVNSISMEFVPQAQIKRAIFAGGCFWGVEYHFQKVPGVLSVVSGYIGGKKENPTYKEICTGTTGHAEAVEIQYDSKRVNFETLAKLFFEIHDPTQADGQGPDIGDQYRSVVFYTDDEQKKTTEQLITKLKDMKLNVVTKVESATKFWPAEDYHQNYYREHKKQPYCHVYTKRFDK